MFYFRVAAYFALAVCIGRMACMRAG